MKLAILGPASLVLATAATAATPSEQASLQSGQAPVPSEQAAASDEEPERKICRTERITGSLTRRSRICLTEAQWREVHARTKQGLDDFNRGASGGCMAPRGGTGGGTMCGG